MTPAELLQTERILGKSFCIMEWQVNDAISRGHEIMGGEDINFLLSLDVKNITSSFQIDYGKIYDSKKFFEFIDESKVNNFQGIRLSIATLKYEDDVRLRNLGYFIKQTGHGSVFWDEVYFTKDAFIVNEIHCFQNLFGSIKSFRDLAII